MVGTQFVAFVDEAPIIEINAGVVHVRSRTGDITIKVATSVCNFGRAVDRAQRALERHKAGDDHIIVDD